MAVLEQLLAWCKAAEHVRGAAAAIEYLRCAECFCVVKLPNRLVVYLEYPVARNVVCAVLSRSPMHKSSDPSSRVIAKLTAA